jgi:deazaflavin-dependent oxidoreductase (nitroreductase family)
LAVNQSSTHYVKPGLVDRLFNSAVAILVRIGVGPAHMRVLEVRGRKTGKLHSLPVDLLDHEHAFFLVAPRGRTQWVRNAEAEGEVTLRRRGRTTRYLLRAVPDTEKPPILKAYLDRFHREVQAFFPLPAGSPIEDFAPLAERYPAFELEALP